MTHEFSPIEPTNTSDTDQSLWQQFLNGDEKAYEKLYNKHIEDLYRYGSMFSGKRELTEDAIHDVFTDIWKCKKNLSNASSVRLYLFSSLKRRLLRGLKKERTYICMNDINQLFPLQLVPSVLDEEINESDQNSFTLKIEKCLKLLTNRQREILYLKFNQNLSYYEIANLLELDQKYVYNTASQAFSRLRAQISGYLFK